MNPQNYPLFQAIDANGNPVAGGLVYTYAPGTSNNKAAYTDKDFTSPASNPITLDSKGEAQFYLKGTYKINVKTSAGVQVDGWPVDNITGIQDGAAQDNYYPDYTEADQGVTGNSTTIKYYVDQIGSDEATIVLRHNSGSATTTYNLDTDETIPENITLQFERGAVIDAVTGDETLTINGGLTAGLWQVFGSSVTVNGTPEIDAIYPEWFGALGNGTHDDKDAFQAALNFTGDDADSSGLPRMTDTPGPVLKIGVPSVYYKITDELTNNKVTVIKGAGQSSIVRFLPSVAGKKCFNFNANYSTLLLKDFSIYGGGQTQDEGFDPGNDDAVGLFIDNSGFVKCENLYIAHFHEGNGLQLGVGVYRGTYVNMNIHDCATGLRIGDDAGATPTNIHSFYGGSIRSCGLSTDAVTGGTDSEKYTYIKNNAGIVLEHAMNILFEGMTFEGQRGAVCLTYRASEIKFNNCWHENNCVLIEPGNAESVADADYGSMMDHFLYAENASGEILNGTDVAISNYSIENCTKYSLYDGVWADSTHKVQGLHIENSYGGNGPSGLKIKNGYTTGVTIKNMSRKDIDYIDPTNLHPTVFTTNASGSYPDDPVVYHQIGDKMLPAEISQRTILAGTDGFIIDATTETHTSEAYIYLDNSMSRSDIEDKINALPKELYGGMRYKFIFADGTYTFASNQLTIEGFSGNGDIQVQSVASDNSQHTNQGVILDFSANDGEGIRVQDIKLNNIHFVDLHIKTGSNVWNGFGLYARQVDYIKIDGCYLEGTTTANGTALEFNYNCNAQLTNNYVNNFDKGIQATTLCNMFSESNEYTVNQPVTGMQVFGSVIMKHNAQITGSSANESASRGGVIR